MGWCPPASVCLNCEEMVTLVLLFLRYLLSVVPTAEHLPAVKHPDNHRSSLNVLSHSLAMCPPHVHDCTYTWDSLHSHLSPKLIL